MEESTPIIPSSSSSSHDEDDPLHLMFFPFMSPGHQIPFLNLILTLFSSSIKSTIITTPINLPFFKPLIHQNPNIINIHIINFPNSPEPEPENLESLPSRAYLPAFYRALSTLHPQADDLVRRLKPDAIISDWNIFWTAQIARDRGIPRILFYPNSVFSVCITDSVNRYRPYMNVNSDHEHFTVPGLPELVRLSRSQIPARFFRNLGMQEISAQLAESENYCYGAVFNSFNELEPDYVKHYELNRGKIWTIGPVSANKNDVSVISNKEESMCLEWLDSKEPESVIYVCFGGLCVFPESQLVEIGLGLELSKCNFIWVVREGYDGLALNDLQKRVRDRGLIITGWAPQVSILGHPSVGGFVSHCGWNSVLEAITYKVPIIAWPLFAEQFYNANFVIKRMRIGFGIGIDTGLVWGDEERAGALVNRGRISGAVVRLLGRNEVVMEMKERVKRLSELARSAISEGGSSHANMEVLVRDLFTQKRFRSGKATID